MTWINLYPVKSVAASESLSSVIQVYSWSHGKVLNVFPAAGHYLPTVQAHALPSPSVEKKDECSSLAAALVKTTETIVPAFQMHANDGQTCEQSAGKLPDLLILILSILGGIVTSMTLVTWSGVLRRSLEP